MAKRSTTEKISRNPKQWDGAETEHSLPIGHKVTVTSFGRTHENWTVDKQTFHQETGLASYTLLAPDGTRYPSIGKWYNKNTHTQIIAW
jgi:hypothetical protein